MTQINKEPTSLSEIQESYDRLYQGWMGEHKNIGQVNRIFDLLNVQSGQVIADIGCGLGYLLSMAEARGLSAFGVDVSETAFKIAQAQNPERPNFILAAAEKLPWPADCIDQLVILGSLEHFLNTADAVQESVRVLKPRGKAAILVPNSHHIRAIYNVYKYGEILSDMQDFERFATRREWENLFRANGLIVESVHKYDVGMARIHRKGRLFFWYLYNILFRILGDRWIPLNLTYTFIFICRPDKREYSYD